MLKVLAAPLSMYNTVLVSHPVKTKSITSGIMYAAGDGIAQYGEHYHNNKILEEGEEKKTFKLDVRRMAILALYGTVIAGPSYHYWFNYLDELPAILWRLKQTRQRGQILKAYAYLRMHGIDVKLDLAKLPKAAPLGKWKAKFAKIAADQFIFSTTYLGVFFIAVGLATGAADRLEMSYKLSEQYDLDHPTASNKLQTIDPGNQPHEPDEALRELLTQLKEHVEEQKQQQKNESIEKDRYHLVADILKKIHWIQEEEERQLSWSEIWRRTWKHTKSVYLETLIADCIIWPPLQLINFTFVPLRFQFLFVNSANLLWNTFLSVMANKKH